MPYYMPSTRTESSEKTPNGKEAKQQPNSKNSYKTWANQGNWNQRLYKTRRSTVSHRICNTDRRNIKVSKRTGPRNSNRIRSEDKHSPMDGRCLPHTPWPQTLQEMLDITNHVVLKYHIEFGAAKCKIVRIGKVKNTKSNATAKPWEK